MPSKRAILRLLPSLAAPAILLALWLPGCNDGDFRTDTGLYAAVSKLMYAEAARTGSLAPLWFPMLGDAPYFNKPPLPFWFHGLSIHLFGPELWAVRLPTLLAAMVGVVALRHAVTTLAGRTAGLFAAVILATTLEFFRYTRAVSLDIWLVMFMLLGLAAAARAVRRDAPREMWPVGVFVGLGLLVKPLYALALPAVLLAWIAWLKMRHTSPHLSEAGGTRSHRLEGGGMRWAGAVTLSVVVALGVAAPWYLSMHARWGEAFLHEHFIRQTLDRAVAVPEGSAAGRGLSALLYLPREFVGTYWPWIIALALAVIVLIRQRRISHSPGLDGLALVWSALFAAGLMLFAGKRSRYMVPLYPGLSMLGAAWLSAHPPASFRRHARRGVTLWAPGLPAVALAGSFTLTQLGVTPHEAPSGDIEALRDAIRQAGDPPTWVAPGAHLNAARLYVKGSPWPRALIVPGIKRTRDLPGTGDIVLFPKDTLESRPALLRPADTIVTSKAGMTAVRAGRPWTPADLDALSAAR